MNGSVLSHTEKLTLDQFQQEFETMLYQLEDALEVDIGEQSEEYKTVINEMIAVLKKAINMISGARLQNTQEDLERYLDEAEASLPDFEMIISYLNSKLVSLTNK